MGNKMQFLLDYYQYMDNIEKLSDIEDNLIYGEIKKHSKFGNLVITEGLIHTYPLNKSVNIIKRRFPELNVHIEEDGEIFIEGEFDELKKYIPLFINIGYFISTYTIDGGEWLKKFDDFTKPIALYLEPKYDINIDPMPKILYHASFKKFENRVSKIGLIPKNSGNKLSNHPDRIYLTDDIYTAKLFGSNLKKEHDDQSIVIYSIDTEGLKINLYRDINLVNGGFYTLGNIPPDHIKKVFTLV